MDQAALADRSAGKRFREETAEIPIANRAYRLRTLGRLQRSASSKGGSPAS